MNSNTKSSQSIVPEGKLQSCTFVGERNAAWGAPRLGVTSAENPVRAESNLQKEILQYLNEVRVKVGDSN